MLSCHPQICRVFDKAETLLRNKMLERPFMIIESGLDIRFDETALKKYREVIESTESTEAYVEAMTRMADDAINIDW